VSVPSPILKDEVREHPVPFEWRSKLREIADSLKAGNFNLRNLECVEPLDEDTAAGIARNIDAYGYTLMALPDECWATAVCRRQLKYWEVLVDLCTVEEGRSDLVLHVNVFEKADSFDYKVRFVYVP